MKVAVIRFPGSNCDLDMMSALKGIPGIEPVLVWHEDGRSGARRRRHCRDPARRVLLR